MAEENPPKKEIADELSSMDFGSLIGGPIQAAVEAQNSASIAQINFIKEVGLDEDNKVIPVDFTYTNGNITRTISVPLISMLNIPSIRIDEMTIDFNAKLTSVETNNVSSQFDTSATLSASYMKIVSLKASASYQKKTSSTSQVEKTYSMVIHVRVVNDELPAGLDRLLTILEDATEVTE